MLNHWANSLKGLFRSEPETETKDWETELDELRHDIEALDQYLHIQNLRRTEEMHFHRMMRARQLGTLAVLTIALLALPSPAHAAGLESSLQSLVGGVVGRILPILALFFVGKNIFDHIRASPRPVTSRSASP